MHISDQSCAVFFKNWSPLTQLFALFYLGVTILGHWASLTSISFMTNPNPDPWTKLSKLNKIKSPMLSKRANQAVNRHLIFSYILVGILLSSACLLIHRVSVILIQDFEGPLTATLEIEPIFPLNEKGGRLNHLLLFSKGQYFLDIYQSR